MKHTEKNSWYVSGKQLGSLVLLGWLLLLSGCGGGKVVKTVDKSADYKSARSLPPLKKPADTSVAKSASEPAAQSADIAATTESADDDERIIYDFTPESSAEPSPEVVATSSNDAGDVLSESDVASEGSVVDTPDDELSNVEPPQVESSSDSGDEAAVSALTAKVIAPQTDVARLQIEAGFDSAWEYLSSNLKRSDLTIFSRNQAAGRYSIGCADIEVAPVVEKRGGWSFLTKKAERHEYCALQVISTKGATVVTVLNRAGEEVSGAYASKVFDRILNN